MYCVPGCVPPGVLWGALQGVHMVQSTYRTLTGGFARPKAAVQGRRPASWAWTVSRRRWASAGSGEQALLQARPQQVARRPAGAAGRAPGCPLLAGTHPTGWGLPGLPPSTLLSPSVLLYVPALRTAVPKSHALGSCGFRASSAPCTHTIVCIQRHICLASRVSVTFLATDLHVGPACSTSMSC